jgi:hypothetical protein
MKIVIQFSTTYLCVKTFSSVTAIKTRHLSQLDISKALRLALTILEPKLYEIIQNKQEQMSYQNVIKI